MTALDRRAVLLLAGAGATGTLLPARAMAAAAATPFIPPTGPMMLTRLLERDLKGDARLAVTRSWRIVFAPTATGYVVDGEQRTVEVDAPPALAALAAVERARSDPLFPVTLDRSGAIVDGGPAIPSHAVDIQLAAMRSRLASRAPGAAALAGQLLAAGPALLTRLPRDLFAPRGDWTQESAVRLPDGETGHVRVNFSSAAGRGGVLLRADRVVLTEAAGSARQARESWTLSPA